MGLFFPEELRPSVRRDRTVQVDRKNFKFTPKPVVFFQSIDELIGEMGNEFVYDCEVYPNFFFVAFKSVKTRKVICFELSPAYTLDTYRLDWMLKNFCIISFNGNHYDMPVMHAALANYDTETIHEVGKRIIEEDRFAADIAEEYDLVMSNCNHIDLKPLVPKDTSLKACAASLGFETIQDLPYEPGTYLTPHEAHITRQYCVNDLDMTIAVYLELKNQISLRERQGAKYGQDLRSRSDAQMAESILSNAIAKRLGYRPQKPTFNSKATFQYDVPESMHFDTPELQRLLADVRHTHFGLSQGGRVLMPKTLEGRVVTVGGRPYALGIGGLHSKEKKQALFTGNGWFVEDDDVTSYYPYLIITQGLFPPQLGREFLDELLVILNTRVEAKEALKNLELKHDIRMEIKAEADGLKIVVNGSFGKFGSKFSILFAPKLMLQVTLSGQLWLLKQIELHAQSGIMVASANTDGVVTYFHESQRAQKEENLRIWREITGLKTETTRYAGIFSRDVNNYIAVMHDFSKCKTKGTYADPWSDKDPDPIERMKKKPFARISTEAAIQFILKNTPIEKTIRECTDFRKFVAVQKVGKRNGVVGACFNGEYLGRVIRWYYRAGETRPIQIVGTGGIVPSSEGGHPAMYIGGGLPDDIDYDWYIAKAVQRLKDVAFIKSATDQVGIEFADNDVDEEAEFTT